MVMLFLFFVFFLNGINCAVMFAFSFFRSYNHLMFADYREPLVEVAAQLLVVLLDHDTMQPTAATMNGTDAEHSFEVSYSCYFTTSLLFTNEHYNL